MGARIMTPAQFMKHVNKLPSELNRQMVAANIAVGENAEKHFKSSFDREGFAGSRNKWPKRSKKYNHSIMNETGRLKNSIKRLLLGSFGTRVITNTPYSQYHNDSTRTNHSQGPGNYKWNIKRQFMGHSAPMNKANAIILRKFINRAFKFMK